MTRYENRLGTKKGQRENKQRDREGDRQQQPFFDGKAARADRCYLVSCRYRAKEQHKRHRRQPDDVAEYAYVIPGKVNVCRSSDPIDFVQHPAIVLSGSQKPGRNGHHGQRADGRKAPIIAWQRNDQKNNLCNDYQSGQILRIQKQHATRGPTGKPTDTVRMLEDPENADQIKRGKGRDQRVGTSLLVQERKKGGSD
nr:hypothetical protein [uncultured Rhodopila sp.]